MTVARAAGTFDAMPSLKSVLKLVVVALVGYIGYEVVNAFLRHRQLSGGPAGRGEMPVLIPAARHYVGKPMGHVGGASMTGGGEGSVVQTSDDEGGPNSTRVGRGVVRRNKN